MARHTKRWKNPARRDRSVTFNGEPVITCATPELAAAVTDLLNNHGHVPDFGPVSRPVRSVDDFGSNGNLIAEIVTIEPSDGFTPVGSTVLDLSYGDEGGFWTRWQPDKLVTNDIDPDVAADHHVDVLDGCPDEWAGQFDTVVWDPPYRLSGTRDSPYDHRFGLDRNNREGEGGYRPVAEINDLLRGGIDFAARAVKPGGSVLVKCQEQSASNTKHDQPDLAVRHAETVGLTRYWKFHLLNLPRKQREPQRSPRSNYSTLLVFKAKKATR